MRKVEYEARFLSSILYDDQHAASTSWSRVQAVLLLLRYSLAAKLVYFGQTVEPSLLEPFARRFDSIILRSFQDILQIESLSEDQKLQVQLAVKEGGCGLRSHDLKELQRLYVSAALLVAPAVFAATGERIGGAGFDAAEGETYDSRLSSSIRDLVAFGVSRPDFDEGGSASAKKVGQVQSR